MDFLSLNSCTRQQLEEEFTKCCGSSRWVEKMLGKRPFKDQEHLFFESEAIWFNECTEKDWLEAFTHHPKIGDLKSLEKKFATTKGWASNEQSGVAKANQQTMQELADLNQRYENKFGYIFIVCATGKSADEMLAILKSRINNSTEEELKIAMTEQNKITRIRLEKMLSVCS